MPILCGPISDCSIICANLHEFYIKLADLLIIGLMLLISTMHSVLNAECTAPSSVLSAACAAYTVLCAQCSVLCSVLRAQCLVLSAVLSVCTELGAQCCVYSIHTHNRFYVWTRSGCWEIGEVLVWIGIADAG
jgi:hypothetical protein